MIVDDFRHWLRAGMALWILSCLANPLAAQAPRSDGAGNLVVVGGSTPPMTDAAWDVMLASRLAGRPIGIISTASEKPLATSAQLAERLNRERGEGSAVPIPLDGTKGNAEDAEIVALIRGCGGLYFTGGRQSRTMRALRRPDGSFTAALEAVWAVHRQGGVIGGNSAGAAIMSDPMITGGNSADALRHGATPADAPSGERGVDYGPGLGFHPGVLYCQHHLERGRFGRLLAALASEALDYQIGIGIAENTAWVVDRARKTGTVIGAKGALYVDSSKAVRSADGGISGVRLHYLDQGDSLLLADGTIVPAAGKAKVARRDGSSAPIEEPDAWSRDAIWHLLTKMAGSGADSAVAHDAHFDLIFRRTPQTRIWKKTTEAEGQRPAWTITHIAVEVTPRKGRAAAGGDAIPAGKASFVVESKNKTLEVFTYRPPSWRKGPLFVILHGLKRNADDYRNNAVALGDRFGALIAAPAFSLEQFPTEAYQRGGITRDGKAQPEEEWTFQHIAGVVAEMRRRAGNADMPYYLIGHSAGGQFLNRLAAFLPGRATRIVSSNPGTLIFPTRDMPFSLGFGELPAKLSDDAWIKRYLAAPLTLYLGTEDTGTQYLDISPRSMRQGATRIERGRACFAMGEALARERGWPFGWTLVEAKGVGHDSKAMFAHPNAQEAIFGPAGAKPPLTPEK